MTIVKPIVNNMRGGFADKTPFERYHMGGSNFGPHGGYNQYGGGYHQPPPTYHHPQIVKQLVFSKTHKGGGGGGGGEHHSSKAAMSALTLLSFLFFLNILQQCLKDQMTSLNPTVAVMTAGRVEEEQEVDSFDREAKTDMLLIRQPTVPTVRLGTGVGRAYPAELNDEVFVKYDNMTASLKSIFKNIENFSD